MQVIPPDEAVPIAVAAPFIVRHWRNDRLYMTEVQFEDGGVWGISDRAIMESRNVRSIMDLAQLFATRPSAFHFVERNRARYAKRFEG